MIRFRNPISDMNILIENFKKMYIDFSTSEYFNLDNIAEFFAREQLASSSGYIGDEALRRSYSIKDDSRKSMKMQAKSYAELFRFLGWISSGEKALNFSFTYLGIHVALSGSGSKNLFEQCLLGVSYPNHILDVKFTDVNKPFVNMLLFADRLDGKLHRDEIILGPMNLIDGYSDKEVSIKVDLIKNIRNTHKIGPLNAEIEKLSDENSMKPNSVRNLTRFVISSLEFSGWFTKQSLKIYGTPAPFLVLTQKGKEVVNSIKNSINIDGNNLDINNPVTKKIADLSLLYMFKRAGFDVDSELKVYADFISELQEQHGKREILFSPYQFFSKDELDELFPENVLETTNTQRNAQIGIDDEVILHSLKVEAFIEAKESSQSKNETLNKKLLKRMDAANGNEGKAINSFLNEIKSMKQTNFYPLVADLLGFIFNRAAFPPSAGNNNMRYDVMIPDEKYSIPVEVKSPTEEEMLSVKAIRQAVENKILLLARKPYNTTFDISTFAVGFNLPNERSDVYKLIDEIYQAYKINVAIMDMETLIRAAFYCAKTKNYYDVSEFSNVKGVIQFED